MGKAMMGTGEAQGEKRALMAAQNAIANPLLDEVSMKGAKAVLVNVTGGMDMTLFEVDEAANAISDQVDPEANIIFGAAFDPSLDGVIRVSVVATGMIEPKPVSRNTTAQPLIADTARPRRKPLRPGRRRSRPPGHALRAAPDRASRRAPVASYAPEPAYEEPAQVVAKPRKTCYFEEPVMEAAPEPRIAAPAPRVTRIVDPMVADAGDEEPLYSETLRRSSRPEVGRLDEPVRWRSPAALRAATGPAAAARRARRRPALQPLDAAGRPTKARIWRSRRSCAAWPTESLDKFSGVPVSVTKPPGRKLRGFCFGRWDWGGAGDRRTARPRSGDL
jgi:cell division protein FtsZ